MGMRILVVDDYEDIATVSAKILSIDHDAVGCNNFVDAINAMIAGDFDVLVTDMQMPHIDGLMMCKLIRRINPACKTILLSGSESIHALKSDNNCIDFTMTKPMNLATMNLILQEIADEQTTHV
jgi:DNA-binding NtrC family response regulator